MHANLSLIGRVIVMNTTQRPYIVSSSMISLNNTLSNVYTLYTVAINLCLQILIAVIFICMALIKINISSHQ